VRPSTPAIVITTRGQLGRPYGVRRRLWRGRYRPPGPGWRARPGARGRSTLSAGRSLRSAGPLGRGRTRSSRSAACSGVEREYLLLEAAEHLISGASQERPPAPIGKALDSVADLCQGDRGRVEIADGRVERGGRSSSTPPAAANRSMRVANRPSAGSGWLTAWVRIARISDSIDRPWRAALIRRRFLMSSSRLRMLIAAMPIPSYAASNAGRAC